MKTILKGKRKPIHGDTPYPPPKKRARTSNLLKRTKSSTDKTNKKLSKADIPSQIRLSPIIEIETTRRGFQFFGGAPSCEKTKNSTEKKCAQPASLTVELFKKNVKYITKKFPKKSEISGPLEFTSLPL